MSNIVAKLRASVEKDAIAFVEQHPILFQKVWFHGESKEEDSAWVGTLQAFERKYGSVLPSNDNSQECLEFIVGAFFLWINRNSNKPWPTELRHCVLPLKAPWVKAMGKFFISGNCQIALQAGRSHPMLSSWYPEVDFRPSEGQQDAVQLSVSQASNPVFDKRKPSYNAAIQYIEKYSHQFDASWHPVHMDNTRSGSWNSAIKAFREMKKFNEWFPAWLLPKDNEFELFEELGKEFQFQIPGPKNSFWEETELGGELLVVLLFLYINRPSNYELPADKTLLKLENSLAKKRERFTSGEAIDPVGDEDKLSRWHPDRFHPEKFDEDVKLPDNDDKDNSDYEPPRRSSRQNRGRKNGNHQSEKNQNGDRNKADAQDGNGKAADASGGYPDYVSDNDLVDLRYVPQCIPCIKKKDGKCGRKLHGAPCQNCVNKAHGDLAVAAIKCILEPLFGQPGCRRKGAAYGTHVWQNVHKSNYSPFGYP